MCGSPSRTPAQADRPGDDTSFCGGAPAALFALASFSRVAAQRGGGRGANLSRTARTACTPRHARLAASPSPGPPGDRCSTATLETCVSST